MARLTLGPDNRPTDPLWPLCGMCSAWCTEFSMVDEGDAIVCTATHHGATDVCRISRRELPSGDVRLVSNRAFPSVAFTARP